MDFLDKQGADVAVRFLPHSLAGTNFFMREFFMSEQKKLVQVKTIIFLVVTIAVAIFSLALLRREAEAAQEELLPQNAALILMPLIELYSELGSDFEASLKVHDYLYTEYIEAIEARTPLYYKVFSWWSNPSNIDELNKIKKLLGKENKETTAEIRVTQAKEAVLEILEELDKFLSIDVTIIKEERMPYELRTEIYKDRNYSHRAVRTYISGVESGIDKNDSFANAQLACQANRRAIGLIYFASLLYQDFYVPEAELIQFREDIDRVVYLNERLSESFHGIKKGLLLEYSNSELHRRAILQAIIEEDIPRAQRLLLDAMRTALAEESADK